MTYDYFACVVRRRRSRHPIGPGILGGIRVLREVRMSINIIVLAMFPARMFPLWPEPAGALAT